jgi:uncharacterized protein (DUF1499 family)
MNGKKIMTTLGILLLVGLGYFKGMGIYSGSKTVDLGLKDNKLQLCGEKPNCVSSFNKNEKHKIEPIETSIDFDIIVEKFKANGLELISQNDNYARFIYSSKIMGYVDDIEILKDGKILHVRSASRVGYSDMGANRKRVESLRLILSK